LPAVLQTRRLFDHAESGAAFPLRLADPYFILVPSGFFLPPSAVMKTVVGPFHPHLESALVEEILSHKKSDPLTPLLILLPSDALRRRVKTVLARERALSLLNVRLLTFFQLSARLCAEAGAPLTEVRDDLFLEEALRHLVRTRHAGAASLAGIEQRVGGCAALWQTVRDLRDGAVDPQLALEALGEGEFARKSHERTRQLFELLHSLLGFCERQKIRTDYDLDKLAAAQAPASKFLGQFAQIFYYGFYDLTQIQIDLFRAVTQNHPSPLLFPLLSLRPSHAAWSFAARFFERHLQGYSSGPVRNLIESGDPNPPRTLALFDESDDRTYGDLPERWQCTVVNAFGIGDEVAAAAKEILRLADEGKIPFHEIGVVARDLQTYGATIKEVFTEHLIPISGSIDEPLLQFPLVKAVILLLRLPTQDFLRAHVIDLLSSPYFQAQPFLRNKARARPDLWDLASRELAICKGVEQWRRLRRFARRGLMVRRGLDDEERAVRIGAAELSGLADIVESLARDLTQLPASSSWSGYAEAWKALLEKYLGIAATKGAAAETDLLKEKILALLDQLAGLDRVNPQCAASEFAQTFERWLERSTVTLSADNHAGVTVLNAATARGLGFRALLILGVNEGVFPRTIREDAFLRDQDREILDRDLGCKINPRLSGFDEEKLLFALLVGAARERLYCSFQRADDSSRPLSPSWYLSELERAIGAQGASRLRKITIPRSASEKSRVAPFDRPEELCPEELAVRLSLEGRDPTSLVELFAPAPALYRHGRDIVAALDRSHERLSGRDGMVGELQDQWKYFFEHGLSPTALETYARCPFQFFARQALGLEPLQRPEEVLGPSAAEYGELGHAILKDVYQSLIDLGCFDGRSVDWIEILNRAAARRLGEYEQHNPVGYALAWEIRKAELMELLRQAIARDLAELSATGFRPLGVEIEESGRLAHDWPAPARGLTVRGRMDRIDWNEADRRLRVVDYKFKLGAAPASADKDLVRAALRGERLQPPFYCLLGRRWSEEKWPDGVDPRVEARFYYLALRWSEGPLTSAEFDERALDPKIAAEVKKTVADLVGGIRRGDFFIRPGAHCEHCEVAEICRKNHPPSLWRAENDPRAKLHREIGQKDARNL